MARTSTEPTDGFLDREFASFREARMRAKRASAEAALEPRRAKADARAGAPAGDAAPPPASPPPAPAPQEPARGASIEALLDGLDPARDLESALADAETTAAGAPPRMNRTSAMEALAAADGAADSTRAMTRPAAPEFEELRAARATGRRPIRTAAERPSSDEHPRPGATPSPPAGRERPSSARLPRPAAGAPASAPGAARVAPDAGPGDVEGSCSDPEFERFRAARRPESARHRKPEGGRAPAPLKPRSAEPLASAAPQVEARGAVDRAGAVEDRCSDPEFEKFRAARQAGEPTPRRPDSARHVKPDVAPAQVPAPEATPAAAATSAQAESGPEATTTTADDAGLFFGTSVTERAMVRARVLDSRSDVETAAPPPAEPPTPAGGERRRAPPPPLPERP